MAIGASFTVTFALGIAAGSAPALVKTAVLAILQAMLISAMIPAAKKVYGHDWIFVCPGTLLALEISQAAVFLGLALNDPQLYLVLFFQFGCAFVFARRGRVAAAMFLRCAHSHARARSQTLFSRTAGTKLK